MTVEWPAINDTFTLSPDPKAQENSERGTQNVRAGGDSGVLLSAVLCQGCQLQCWSLFSCDYLCKTLTTLGQQTVMGWGSWSLIFLRIYRQLIVAVEGRDIFLVSCSHWLGVHASVISKTHWVIFFLRERWNYRVPRKRRKESTAMWGDKRE